MNRTLRLLFSGILLLFAGRAQAQRELIYEMSTGKVAFHSNAPKELISATSTKLRGIIDVTRRTFAFRINMATFQGFNTPLQREHFNENYIETSVFPEATFSGKIIEEVDLQREGTYEVRAKGKFSVHGIVQERIIKSSVTVKNRRLTISSDFLVLLADHNIKIPRVVYEKLSPQINVTVQAVFLPRT